MRYVCMRCEAHIRGAKDAPIVSHGLCEPCGIEEFQRLGLKRKAVVSLPYLTLPPLEDLTKRMSRPLEFELTNEAIRAFEAAAQSLGPFEGVHAWEKAPGILTLKASSPAGFKDLLGALTYQSERADESRELARSLLDSIGFRWT